MKQIEVQIMQQSYVLTCPEGHEERLLSAVRRVDESMTRIRDSGKVRSRERVAVLAALNMAFDVLDSEERISQIRAEAETEIQAAKAWVAKLQESLPITRQLADDYKRLLDKAIIGKHGFDFDSWSAVSQQVTQAYMAVKLGADGQDVMGQMRQSMAQFILQAATNVAQQKNLDLYPDRRLLLLNIDAGGVRARRLIEQAIAAESG